MFELESFEIERRHGDMDSGSKNCQNTFRAEGMSSDESDVDGYRGRLSRQDGGPGDILTFHCALESIDEQRLAVGILSER